MKLPKLNFPTYSFQLPSTNETVLFRPFTVKEEIILLVSADNDDETQIRALRQVLDNCLLPGVNGKTLDVTKLSFFDLDYLWLKIRSKSVEEVIMLPFECREKLPDGKTITEEDGTIRDYCGTVVNVPVDLDKIEVKKNPANNPKIELQDGIGIVMKYPTFETLQKLNKMKEDNDVALTFEVIMDCIEMIYDADGKTYEKEYVDKEELTEFLESMTQPQSKKIMEFFDTLPVLRHQVHFRCPKCKHEADVIVEGTKSFLALDSTMNPLVT